MKSYLMSGVVSLAALTAAAMPASAKTTFEFWYGLSGGLSERVQELCTKFNASQQDYEIVCVSQDTYDNNLQNTIAAFRANGQPTIAQIHDAGTLDLMLSGAVMPIRDLMASNGYDIDWNDYFGGIAAYFSTSKGEMMSLPFNNSTAMMYYNLDALEKVGFQGTPKTWEEVEDVARKMKAAGYDCPIAFDPVGGVWQWFEQFHMAHNQPIASKGNGFEGLDAELVFNKGLFVQQLERFKRMYDEGLMVHKSKTAGETANDSFVNARCMMTSTSVADHGVFGEQAVEGMRWTADMVPVLAGTERTNTVVGGASLWTLKGKSEAEYKAAAAFYSYLATPEQAQWWSTVTGYIPVTNSSFDTMKKNGFYDAAPYKGRELAIASLTATAPTENTRGIRLGNYVSIRAIVGDAIAKTLFDNVPPQQSLDEAVAKGNDVLRRFERTYNGVQLP